MTQKDKYFLEVLSRNAKYLSVTGFQRYFLDKFKEKKDF